MRALYNFFIFLFDIGLRTSSLLGNQKAQKWVNGRKGLFNKLQKALPQEKDVVWFHCASLGEFEQARNLLEKIKKEHDFFILLTFFSPSGYESKKNYPYADYITYLPLDSPANARRFVQMVQPKLSFFAKYEFWFNILKELKKGEHKHFLISGIFRKGQQFFRFYGKWFRQHLANFDHLYLQDENSQNILRSFEIDQCSISGDGRFDRVWNIAQEEYQDSIIQDFIGVNRTIIFGSSWEKENELAFKLAKEKSKIKVIIAPHEFHPKAIEKLSSKYDLEASYYSKFKEDEKDNRVLVIDQVGLLAKIYRYGELAVVGGGFGKGIHNILEAAVYGIPVVFGPNYRIFNEAWELLEKGGAKVFKNETQFDSIISEILNDNSMAKKMGEVNREYFYQKRGATDLIYNNLVELKHLQPKD